MVKFRLLNCDRPGLVTDLVVAGVFFVGVWVLLPLRDQFAFDTDEGLNVMKAVLVAQGDRLYDDIWNDQPPLFTLILSGTFTFFGPSILVARLLVLMFASILVSCFHRLVRLTVGGVPAIAATFLLISSYEFIRLSASVMIGIPSMALAMLSLVLLEQHQRQDDSGDLQQEHPRSPGIWLWASGLCFACSLLMKLVTAIFIPLVCLQIVMPNYLRLCPGKRRAIAVRQRRREGLIWLASMAVPFLVMGVAFSYFQLDQALTTHLQSRSGIEEFERRSLSFAHLLDATFSHDGWIYALALLGVGIASIGRDRTALLPGLWLITVAGVLASHQPVWYHYAPLLMVPLCWLAAYGMLPLAGFLQKILAVMKGWARSEQRHGKTLHRRVAMGAIALVGILTVGAVMMEVRGAIAALDRYGNGGHSPQPKALVETIRQYQDEDKPDQPSGDRPWFVTDMPLYAFYAGVPVPPELAVFSKKRVLTGHLTPETVLTVLQTYEPQQLLFSRFANEIAQQPLLARHLQRHYQHVPTAEELEVEYYVAAD